MVHSKVADEMLDGNIAIKEEENEFLAIELLYLSCQRDPDKPRYKASQMLVPASKGEASEPSLVEVTVESKLDLANPNPEEQNTASVDFPDTGGDRADYGGQLVVSANAQAEANQALLCMAITLVTLSNQKRPETTKNITPTADIVTNGGGLESFAEYANEKYEQFQNTVQEQEEEISQLQLLRMNSGPYLNVLCKDQPAPVVNVDSGKAQAMMPEANIKTVTKKSDTNIREG